MTNSPTPRRIVADVGYSLGLPIGILAFAYAQPFPGWQSWAVVLIAVAASVVIIGFRVTKRWRGCLIDRRHMVSLSKFQLILWTVIVVSAFLMAVMINLRAGADDPLAVGVPSQLWVLMGISATSLIGSPLVLNSKTNKEVDEQEVRHVCDQRCDQTGLPENAHDRQGAVYRNRAPEFARFSDMFKGEEVGNAATMDIAKVQMFYFTIVLAAVYCFSIAVLFNDPTPTIAALPAIPESMLALLGISHTSYLAAKALPHTPEPKPSEGSASAPKKKAAKKKTAQSGNES